MDGRGRHQLDEGGRHRPSGHQSGPGGGLRRYGRDRNGLHRSLSGADLGPQIPNYRLHPHQYPPLTLASTSGTPRLIVDGAATLATVAAPLAGSQGFEKVEGLGARLVRTGEMGGEFFGQATGAHGSKVRMAIVSLPDQMTELLEYQGRKRPSEPAKPFAAGFAHLVLVVDGIDELLARIAAYGWKAQGVLQPIASGARRDAGDLRRWS